MRPGVRIKIATLDRARICNRLSRRDLARAVGISLSSLARICQRSRCGEVTLWKLAAALDVQIEDLLGEERQERADHAA